MSKLMIMRKFFPKIKAVLILATIAVVAWISFNTLTTAPVSLAKVQPPKARSTEDMNITKLNTLLESSGVRIDEATLLPSGIDRSQTILVRLQSGDSNKFAEQPAENASVSLLKTKSEAGALSRQRSFELSPNLILSVAVNAQKEVLWWDLQPDPRVFRAETSDDAGRLSGKTLYLQDAEFIVSLPADETIAEVRFYHPVWDGTSAYSLQSIGNLNLK